VGVRAAGPDDFEEVVARVRRPPLSAVTAWALAPAPDIIEAHLAYCRWHVAELLRIGRIWLDDRTVVGGRRLQVRLGHPHPDYRDPRVGRRGSPYPDRHGVPAACWQRVRAVSVAGLALRPSSIRRTLLVHVWGAAGDDAGPDPLDAVVRHGQAIRHACLAFTSGPGGGTDRLRRAGFVPVGDAPAGADGRPALTAWERRAGAQGVDGRL
jgi:hypothetical protein